MVTGPFVRVHFSEKARFSIQSSRTAILGLSSSSSSGSGSFSNCSVYNKSNFHYTLRCGGGARGGGGAGRGTGKTNCSKGRGRVTRLHREMHGKRARCIPNQIPTRAPNQS